MKWQNLEWKPPCVFDSSFDHHKKDKDEARIDFVDDEDDASSPHISLLLRVKLLVFISRLEIIIIIAFWRRKKRSWEKEET